MEPMGNHPLRFLPLMIASWMNRKQLEVIAYLQVPAPIPMRLVREDEGKSLLASDSPDRGHRFCSYCNHERAASSFTVRWWSLL